MASALAVPRSLAAAHVPRWLESRLGNVDLNSGPVAKLFTHLAEVNTPRSRAVLEGIHAATDTLGLDDTLLESLLDDIVA